MKSVRIFMLLGVIFNCLSLHAWEKESGAGDLRAEAFTNRSRFILVKLLSSPQKMLTPSELIAFAVALDSVDVVLTDKDLTDDNTGSVITGKPVKDANGDWQIFLNIPLWEKALAGELNVNTIRFVFHEYLQVIEKDDHNNRISRRLGLTEQDYLKWKNSPSIDSEIKSLVIHVPIRGSFHKLRYPAVDSYEIECVKFKREIKEQFGQVPMDCGKRSDGKVRSVYNPQSRYPDYDDQGYQSGSDGSFSIALDNDRTLVSRTKLIKGTVIKYNRKDEVKARELAYESYRVACEKAKSDIKSDPLFVGRLVHFACDQTVFNSFKKHARESSRIQTCRSTDPAHCRFHATRRGWKRPNRYPWDDAYISGPSQDKRKYQIHYETSGKIYYYLEK